MDKERLGLLKASGEVSLKYRVKIPALASLSSTQQTYVHLNLCQLHLLGKLRESSLGSLAHCSMSRNIMSFEDLSG